MATKIQNGVKEYYGRILRTSGDLKSNACAQVGKVRKQVKEALNLCHEEVTSKYYGCGLPFPTAVEGLNVLDFGSGTGRDCFILSHLVGKDGFVTGVDMTEELVGVATKYIPYHTEKFGYSEPNVDFKLGYVENLKDVGIENESCDLIVSNCVINLCPEKPPVFREAVRVLKEGGELYFSDMYVDRPLPEGFLGNKELSQELWGEGFAGALHWKSFVDLCTEIGFSGPHLVSSRSMSCDNEELAKLLGDAKYVAATYRMFKISTTPDEKSCSSVKYKGTITDCPETFKFDCNHTFDSNFQAVSCGIANVLKNSRYCQHFEFKDAEPTCTAPRTPANSTDPFEVASADAEKPPSCKKAKSCG